MSALLSVLMLSGSSQQHFQPEFNLPSTLISSNHIHVDNLFNHFRYINKSFMLSLACYLMLAI